MEKTDNNFQAERLYFAGPGCTEQINEGTEPMVRASDYDNLLDAFLNNCGLDDLQVLESIASAAARRMYERLEVVTSNLPASYRVYACKLFAEEFKRCAGHLR